MVFNGQLGAYLGFAHSVRGYAIYPNSVQVMLN